VYSTGSISNEQLYAIENQSFTDKGQVMITLAIPAGCTGACVDAWLAAVYEPAYHNYFKSHFQLKTNFPIVFTKMISYKGSYLIFDREAASISFMDKNGMIFKEIGMDTKMNGIKYKDVHFDTRTGKIFIEYPQGPYTYFVEITPESGQEIRRFMIRDYRYIEKCTFLNNRLYFLYQPETGLRIKKLFSIWI
jgi:hypothetical protein